MRILKPLSYFLALVLAIVPLVSCSLFDRHQKNEEGFYEQHYNCCGPIALEQAFNELYTREGIVFVGHHASRKEISQKIQSRGVSAKELLSYFNKDAICITWPSEIKDVAEEYGFELITVDEIDELDPKKDIAIVLVHGNFFSEQYHWVVFPIDDVKDYYGDKTVIDIIYLLKLTHPEE